jgi:hypothetical protein
VLGRLRKDASKVESYVCVFQVLVFFLASCCEYCNGISDFVRRLKLHEQLNNHKLIQDSR